MIEVAITPSITSLTRIVETAFISGVTPSLTIEYIFIGSVVDLGPAAKLAMTKSSRDRVNDNSHPETTAGTIIGRVISRKV
jgi:hypothetical protein